MHDICTEFKLLLKSWNWLGYNLIWMKSNLYYSPSFKSSVILGCLFAALGIDLVSLLKSKYLILIPTICWTYFWDSCLWTGPLWRPIWFVLSLHRKAGKQENESSKDEKRETGKRGTQEGSWEFSLLRVHLHISCAATWTELNLCVCVFVCGHGCVILIPSLYSRSPLLFLLQRLSSGGCWLQILPYMVILSSLLSAFQTHFLFPFHWLKHCACAQ